MHESIAAARRIAAAIAVLSVAVLFLQACSPPTRLDPPPQTLTDEAAVLGIPNARFYPDTQSAALVQEGIASVQREVETEGYDIHQLPPVYFLAVSGGGDDGAFGAGLLTGWTEAGTRPEFKLVTGVSTGSLIAPFAFLGPAYDEKLKAVYTTISAADVFEERGLFAAFDNDALRDTAPLFATMSKYLDDKMLRDIAAEYDRGRLLIIGSTNLDAQRPVLWNIGAIAKSGHPEALTLVRKILLASAAVPAAFPPVLIDVEADGEVYQELHVDGGAIAQLFLYPPAVGAAMREARQTQHLGRERTAYVIFNGRLDPQWARIERSTLPIAGRAISTMIHSSALNDLIRVYVSTQRDGVDFNLAAIGTDFATPRPDGEFDPTYMQALFDYGHALGRGGYPWQKVPPLLKSPQDVVTILTN